MLTIAKIPIICLSHGTNVMKALEIVLAKSSKYLHIILNKIRYGWLINSFFFNSMLILLIIIHHRFTALFRKFVYLDMHNITDRDGITLASCTSTVATYQGHHGGALRCSRLRSRQTRSWCAGWSPWSAAGWRVPWGDSVGPGATVSRPCAHSLAVICCTSLLWSRHEIMIWNITYFRVRYILLYLKY